MAKAKSPPKSPEFKKFEAKARSVLRAAHVYSTTGGSDDHTESRKLIDAMHRGREALYDMQRRLGLTPGQWQENPVESAAADELLERVKRAVAGAPEAGAAVRAEIRRGETRKLDEAKWAHRAWRIENGLEDPPKTY